LQIIGSRKTVPPCKKKEFLFQCRFVWKFDLRGYYEWFRLVKATFF
jgi:hypothetical protein